MASPRQSKSDTGLPPIEWNRPTGDGPAPSLFSLGTLINQAIPDALFVHDHEGRFIEVNDRACISTGYTHQELLGMGVCDLETDFDLEAAQAEWLKIEPMGRTQLSGHHRRKDGSTFPVEIHFGLLNYRGRRLYLGVVEDVSLRDAERAALRASELRELTLEREKRQLAEALHKHAEGRYAGLVSTMSEGAVIQDAQGRIEAANPAAAVILGLSMDQLMGKTSMDPSWQAVHEDGSPWPGEEHPAMAALASGKSLRNQVMGVSNTERGRRWISINAMPLYLASRSKPDGVLATFADITEQKRRDDALQESNAQLEAVFASSSLAIGVSILSTGSLVRVNRAFAELFGYSENELMGHSTKELGLWPDRSRREQMLDALRRGEPVRDWLLPFRRKDGSMGEAQVAASLVPLNGELCLIGMLADVTESRRLQADLTRLATTDVLTGLANRARFFEQAGQELVRADRYELPLSLLMLDLDHFKRINDEHGHAAGDAVLAQLGVRLRNLLRDIDVAGRIGGEEFAVLLPQTGEARALAVAERIRLAVAEEPFKHGAVLLAVTLSIGVAGKDGGVADLDTLLARADAGLYWAKGNGRNQVCVGD